MKTIAIAALVALIGCSTAPEQKTDVSDGNGGANTAQADDAGSGGQSFIPLSETNGDPECLTLLGIQGANGKWCATEQASEGTPVRIEYSDWSECYWCYRRACPVGADGYWIPVEC